MSQGQAIVGIGTQWGDEGKGRVTDLVAADVGCTVRFNGGANAGHTLVVGDKKYVTHLLPSGMVRPGMINMVGPYVVCDLEEMVRELEIAQACGSAVYLDRSTPVVLPIHKLIDAGREAQAGKSAIGTTGRGIGPAYEDFWSRRAIKLGDLVSERRLRAALTERNYYAEKQALARYLGVNPVSLDQVVAWCMQFSCQIKPLLADVREMIASSLNNGVNVFFEGAQGVLLDTIHGSQPFTTSSCCTAGAVAATMGVHHFDRVIGVAKAYVTRVGEGPFPTEQINQFGQQLAQRGGEVGATTGRPRRCGWLDLVALRYACRVAGITELIITKLDVLSGFSVLPVCQLYRFEGRPLGRYETLTGRVLREAEPVYTDHVGWSRDISECRSLANLPSAAVLYVENIASFTGVPVVGISVGPERDQYIRASIPPS